MNRFVYFLSFLFLFSSCISTRTYEDRIAEWYETYDTHYVVDGKSIHAVGYYGDD